MKITVYLPGLRTLRALLAIGALIAIPAVQARAANSVGLTVKDPYGGTDPAAELVNSYAFSGTADALSGGSAPRLYVKTRAVGGAPCAPSPNKDGGSYVAELPNGLSVGPGTFSVSRSGMWRNAWGLLGSPTTPLPAGDWFVCMWLTASESTDGPVFTQVLHLRAPRVSLGVSLSPPTPYPGERVTVTFHGATEVRRLIMVRSRAAGGAPCAPTFRTDEGSEPTTDRALGPAEGTFSTSFITTWSAGTRQLCTWLNTSSNDNSPLLTQTTIFRVRSKSTTTAIALQMRPRRTVRATGTVRGPAGGMPAGRCLLQRRVGVKWKAVGKPAPLSPGGKCTLIRVVLASKPTLRIVFAPATAQWAPSRSLVRRVATRR